MRYRFARLNSVIEVLYELAEDEGLHVLGQEVEKLPVAHLEMCYRDIQNIYYMYIRSMDFGISITINPPRTGHQCPPARLSAA